MENKIVVSCESCRRKLRLNASHAGKKIRCPACQAVFAVPVSTIGTSAAGTSVDSTADASRAVSAPVPPPAKRPESPRKKAAPKTSVSDDMWLEDPNQEFSEQDDWADESNPYAPPKTQSIPRRSPQSTGAGEWFDVEGSLIRCGHEVRLPAICIKTGATSNLKEVSKKLKHTPIWAYLVGGVLLALVMQKSCKVTYFVGEAARKKQFTILLIGFAIVGAGIISLIIAAAVNIPEAFVLPGVLLIIAGLITAVVSTQALKITTQEGGRVFWISGCKPEFFATLSRRSSSRT